MFLFVRKLNAALCVLSFSLFWEHNKHLCVRLAPSSQDHQASSETNKINFYNQLTQQCVYKPNFNLKLASSMIGHVDYGRRRIISKSQTILLHTFIFYLIGYKLMYRAGTCNLQIKFICAFYG